MSTATADPAEQDSPALIRHILDRYHTVHRCELPGLIRLARRVETAHRDHPQAPLGLAELLAQVEYEMEAHMRKEEQALFPMILSGHPDLAMPIEIMRDDHDDHAKRLAAVEALTRGHTPPEDACGSWRLLCAGTRKLAEDLAEHIRLENDVLFPRHGG